MKKLIITAVLAVSIATSAFATSGINSVAVKNFKHDFKNVTQVQWQVLGSHSIASFIRNGETVTAFYNDRGELYGTGVRINTEELPLGVKRSISKKLGGYTVLESMLFTSDTETAYIITAENDNETVSAKVVDGVLSLHKRQAKSRAIIRSASGFETED